MISARKALGVLLDREAEGRRSDSLFLSAYHPASHITPLELRKALRYLIVGALRKDERTASLPGVHEHIVEKVNGLIAPDEDAGMGAGAYVKFRAGTHRKQEKIPDSDVTAVRFSRVPRREVHIAETFNLDQLIWMANAAVTALVLNLKKDRCDIFTLEDGDIRMVTEKENVFVRFQRDQDIGGHSAATRGKSYRGTAHDKTDRKVIQGEKRFVKQLATFLRRDKRLKAGFGYVVVFHSKIFSSLVEHILDNPPNGLTNSTFIPVAKNVRTTERLQQEALQTVERCRRSEKQASLKAAREDHVRYAEGFKDVSKASRAKSIETMFIRYGATRRGYVLGKDLVYTHPVKGSRLVRNITPWLIRSVMQSKGNILILKDDLFADEPDISSRLRYPKDGGVA
jgi:hypothetical protein